MNTWLALLPLEIRDVNDLIAPLEQVNEGEKVVGVVSEELRKLYTLWKSLEKKAGLLQVELKYTKATEEERAKVSELNSKAKALSMLFWIGVLDELNLWGHPEQCAIRGEWQVVEFPAPPSPFPFQFMVGPP